MKNQRIAFWLILFAGVLYANDLPRADKYQGPFLIIVGVFSVFLITTLYLFQKDGVEAKIQSVSMSWVCVCEINHTHQRMQGLRIVKGVVIADGLKPN